MIAVDADGADALPGEQLVGGVEDALARAGASALRSAQGCTRSCLSMRAMPMPLASVLAS